MMISRTFDILALQLKKYPQDKTIVCLEHGSWNAYSTQSCIELADQYSRCLLAAGIQKGDRVVIIPHLATADWVLLDLAIQQVGAIVVPVHFSSPVDQLHYVLKHTEAKLCFIEDAVQGEKCAPATRVFPDLQLVYLKEAPADGTDLASWSKPSPKQQSIDLESIKAGVKTEDLAAILYTSGTTGIPKGVMLSHANIVSNLHAVIPLLPINSRKTVMSFLPFSHILERMTLYTYLATGAQLYLPGDRDYLPIAFKEVKPHIFTSVPRILEKMYEIILAKRPTMNWLQRKIATWAIQIGKNYRERPSVAPLYWIKLQLARLLVFRKLKNELGGRVEAIVIGAAYLQPELGRLFGAMKIKVREGYGMTETSPVVTLNRFRPGLYSFGTVGLPIPGVNIRIADPDEQGEGEILVKGPNVMLGYYKNPEATAAVLKADGWLHTGDIGKFVKSRFLQITDRKRDIFKTSSGEFIAPLVLENHLKQSPYIEQVIAVGFQHPFVTAIIKPNFPLLENWCRAKEIHWTGPEYMVHNIKVKEKMQSEIDKLNTELPNYQTIRAFHLTAREWTIESGLLTYTMKMVRAKILETYVKEIEELYEEHGGSVE
ncbi:MAG: AMP-dependent synthetase [Saprospiraceae bacterium]|nr:MAG: AMP-dependent synthetase [Saprospiraceae bacterium]